MDIHGGSQDLCKFSLDLRIPLSIYTGMVCHSRCQGHICQSTELFLELDQWTLQQPPCGHFKTIANRHG